MTRLLALGAAGAIAAAIVLGRLVNPSTMEKTALPAPAEAVAASGQVIEVRRGGDLQAALNAARPGGVIALPPGAVFVGNFILPDKPGAQWIVIRSSAHEELPPPGSRVSPDLADLMPKIVSPNRDPAIRTATRAHHYRFTGIEITTTSPVNFGLIGLESPGQTSLDQVPTFIVFDRCYIHGTPTASIRRGIVLNGAHLAVVDSYLSDFHEHGPDTQAIAGWNGPGPFTIVNNYLEAAGENIMFGGADPSIPNLVPSDIEVRGNYFFKPLSWRVGDPTYAGIPWTVKNLFELKNAQRVLVDGNIFENNWVQADQNGFAILFNVTNQEGTAPWTVVADVTFTHNLVCHSTAGMEFQGQDYRVGHPSRTEERILLQNNLFIDIGAYSANGGHVGFLTLFSVGPSHVTIDHNTFLSSSFAAYGATGAPPPLPNATTGFVFTNNIASHDFTGDGGPIGTATLMQYFPGAVFEKNVMVGVNPLLYPARNFFPATFNEVGFVDYADGDYRLSTRSPYKNAGTDGKDIGADIDALAAAMASWSADSDDRDRAEPCGRD